MEGGEVLGKGWWFSIANDEKERRFSVRVVFSVTTLTGSIQIRQKKTSFIEKPFSQSSRLKVDLKEWQRGEVTDVILRTRPEEMTRVSRRDYYWQHKAQWTQAARCSPVCTGSGTSSEAPVQVHAPGPRQTQALLFLDQLSLCMKFPVCQHRTRWAQLRTVAQSALRET